MRRGMLVLAILAALATASAGSSAPPRATCSSSSVQGLIGGVPKCLRAGEFCSPGSEPNYERYGFSCVAGRLRTGGSAPAPAPVVAPVKAAVGTSVALGRRTRARRCHKGALPDRRCSPGAYYSGLTQAVICAPGFRTGTVRNVPQSEKFTVEVEYGMAATHYGRTIEIDHVVPLELGGSNVLSNLFPEPGSGTASYHAKDRLEDRLHDLVCGGRINLAAARRGIAADWELEYRKIFGLAP